MTSHIIKRYNRYIIQRKHERSDIFLMIQMLKKSDSESSVMTYEQVLAFAGKMHECIYFLENSIYKIALLSCREIDLNSPFVIKTITKNSITWSRDMFVQMSYKDCLGCVFEVYRLIWPALLY